MNYEQRGPFHTNSIGLELFEFKAVQDHEPTKSFIKTFNDKEKFAIHKTRTNTVFNQSNPAFSIYTNKQFTSKMFDMDIGDYESIENDWQDEQTTVSPLANYLDILPRVPGIYPVESICRFDHDRLHPFFTRIPQYS